MRLRSLSIMHENSEGIQNFRCHVNMYHQIILTNQENVKNYAAQFMDTGYGHDRVTWIGKIFKETR